MRRKLYDSPNPHKLYKNPDNRRIAGVCAGIADYLDASPSAIRILVFLGFIFFSAPIFITYVVLAVFLDRKPPMLYRSSDEEDFWRSVSLRPKDTLGNLRHNFRKMEGRLAKIESYVTSSEFELEKKYRDLT